MLIAISKYTKPLPEVDAHRKAHKAYIKSLFEAGKLLISGRQTPPEGGVIIARTQSRAEFQEILDNDPFTKAGVTHYHVTEFVPVMAQDELKAFLSQSLI